MSSRGLVWFIIVSDHWTKKHWTSPPKIYKGEYLLILKKKTRKTAKLNHLIFDTKAYYAVSLNVLFFLYSKAFGKTKNFGGLIEMEMTKELAELTGIMCGDGCLSSYKKKYIIYICGHKQDDREYHEITTKKLFINLFNKEVKIQERKEENALFIRFSDKKIFYMLNSFGIPIGKKYDKLKVPDWVIDSSELSFSFIRGLADTDGCVFFSKQHRKVGYYPRIEIASKSRIFLEEVLSILVSNGFYGSLSQSSQYSRLEIPGFKNLDRWLNLIGFNNPKHMKKIEAHIGPITPPTRILTSQKN